MEQIRKKLLDSDMVVFATPLYYYGMTAQLKAAVDRFCAYNSSLNSRHLAASFRKQGMREDWLAAFMMASILLNPPLIIYSAALGTAALTVRIVTCFCAAAARDFWFFCFTGTGISLISAALKKKPVTTRIRIC